MFNPDTHLVLHSGHRNDDDLAPRVQLFRPRLEVPRPRWSTEMLRVFRRGVAP